MRLLAVLIPLTVLATRFQIYPGLWINDFVVVVIALWTMFYSPPNVRSKFAKLLVMFWLYCALHSAVLAVIVQDRSVSIANNLARITTVVFCGLCFDAFYRKIDRQSAVAGIRQAAILLALSVIAHSIILNLAGDAIRSRSFLSAFDAECYERDMAIVGFGRAFGLAFEPYWAAAYLFLLSCILRILDPRRAPYIHGLLLFAAALTAATSLVVFVPVWLFVHLTARSARRQLVVLAAAVGLLTFGVLSFGLVERISERIGNLQAGADMSGLYRVAPPVRTVLGVFKAAPFSGFGLGNAALADSVGYDLVTNPLLKITPKGSYSSIAPIEMLAGLGIPGLLFYLAFITSSPKVAGARWSHYLWALCLVTASNAYLFPHSQLYLFCTWGGLLSSTLRESAARSSSRSVSRMSGLVGVRHPALP